MTDIVERLRNHADESLLDDYRTVCEKFNQPNMMLEAADMIQRLLGHIDLLHDEIERLRGERKALDEALRQEIHHGTVRHERYARGADADTQRAPGDH